jgi:hypothetical protein
VTDGPLQHTVLLALAPDVSDEHVAAIVAGLAALPGLVETLDAIEVERDLGVDPRSAQLLIRARFPSVAAWQAYQDHPAHRAVIDDLIAPVLVARSAVQHLRSGPADLTGPTGLTGR